MCRIYISAPLRFNTKELEKIKEKILLYNENIIVKYWRQNDKYDNDIIAKSDIILIVNEKNSFNYNTKELAPGVLSEFSRAIKSNKSVYTVYINASGDYNFYKCNYNSGTNFIGSKAGSSVNWKHKVDEIINVPTPNTFKEGDRVYILPEYVDSYTISYFGSDASFIVRDTHKDYVFIESTVNGRSLMMNNHKLMLSKTLPKEPTPSTSYINRKPVPCFGSDLTNLCSELPDKEPIDTINKLLLLI